MEAHKHFPSADLTAPLVSPEISSRFEALLAGRCSLSELRRSVLEACESDPDAAEGVLLLLEGYEDSGDSGRFDFRSLKRDLQCREETRDALPGIRDSFESGADIDPTRSLDEPDAELDEGHDDAVEERADSGFEDPATAPLDQPGMLRGRYVLEAEIGHGGLGTVYRALDLNRTGLPPHDQYVALKLLREEAARRPDAVNALRREYHQAQLLTHPGIVNVFDFDHHGSTHFVTMELIEGEALGELTRRLLPERLPVETAVRMLRELGDAVAYAHDRGVLHLDLKPDNVMIDSEGHVRVLDFGLAQSRMVEPGISETRSPPAATPAYASCERLAQEPPDVRDDVFSFSCIAYELLSGNHPFDRYSALQARKEGRTAPPIRNLSRRQWRALRAGLAWAREDRPSNMRELLQGLALPMNPATQVPLESRASRTANYAVAAMALLGLGTAGLLGWDRLQGRAGQPAETSASGVERDTRGRTLAEPARAIPVAMESATRSLGPNPTFAAVTPGVATSDVATSVVATPDVATPDVTPAQPAPTRQLSRPRKVASASGVGSAAAKPDVIALDVLGFSRHSFPVSEADPVVHLDVRRLGSATGDVSFRWHTVDDSAIAGQDYVFETGEVVMTSGQTSATLDVPIVADSVPENPKLLQVVIAESRGARVGPAGRAPVIIVDDD